PVQTGDKVVAGELLVRLRDKEVQARIANAQAQIAMRKRARNDQAPSSRAGERRKAEDAVSDGEKAVVEAQAAFDKTARDRRAGGASDSDLEAARAVLSRARDQRKQLRAELRNRVASQCQAGGAGDSIRDPAAALARRCLGIARARGAR